MRVLITGKGSYIGEHIKSHLESFEHIVDEVDTLNDHWKEIDFSQYDSIVHVAAIVHNDAKDASEELFTKVNTDLPVSIAKTAKENGVKQFVFMSTMGVFGKGKALLKEDSVVTKDTVPNAVGGYGGSKLQAEKQLNDLESDSFKVAIVRPPNVYGPGCKGNYIPLFKKLALKLFICPYAYINIRQSMLYIANLSELVRLIIDNHSDSIYMPQDDCIPNTVEIIRIIRSVYGKETHVSKLLGYFVKAFHKLPLINKVYGGIQYEESLSNCFDNRYQIVSFVRGVGLTYEEHKETRS